jgi:hypothetical protein
MQTVVFESKLLPDGHLYCPEEFLQKKNVRFKVVVTLGETYPEAADRDLAQAAIHDVSEDFLTSEELRYYLNLQNWELIGGCSDFVPNRQADRT